MSLDSVRCGDHRRVNLAGSVSADEIRQLRLLLAEPTDTVLIELGNVRAIPGNGAWAGLLLHHVPLNGKHVAFACGQPLAHGCARMVAAYFDLPSFTVAKTTAQAIRWLNARRFAGDASRTLPHCVSPRVEWGARGGTSAISPHWLPPANRGEILLNETGQAGLC